VTSDVDNDAGALLADIQAILARIENDHPDLAAAALTREVDSLLGRKPTTMQPARPAGTRAPKRSRSSEDSPFAWYQPIVAGLPPVMSSAETIAAARAVEVGLFAEERLATLARVSRNFVHMRELCTLIDEGREAFHALIVSNLRLVFHWSKGVASSLGKDWAQDAFQAGCIGLIRGLQSWDYTTGYTLSTYVSWHIRQQIQRWRCNEVALIRLPVHVWERLESDPDGLSAATKAATLQALDIVSIEDVEEDDLSLVWDGGLEEIARRTEMDRILAQLFDDLTEREADVLKLRHGLDDMSDGPMTLDAIGQMYGVTRERIRQIESKALEKLQDHPLRAALVDLWYGSLGVVLLWAAKGGRTGIPAIDRNSPSAIGP
jgi:RNA polymerase primary sigma factor